MAALLSFEDVCFSYDGNNRVLKHISFTLNKGERVALLGLNGSGTSTLILHTNGLLQPKEGNVRVDGIDTRSKELPAIRKKVGLVFQNPDDQLFMPTVKEDVAFGPLNMQLSEEEVEQRVNHALRITGTEHLALKFPYELSGGQKKSVSIATVLSMNPELLVMDEPSSGLDYAATRNLIEILKSLPQAMLISTHDMELARELCSRALLLENGALVYDAPLESLNYPPF